MTENDRITLMHFEQKLHLLLHSYKQLQERNSELESLMEEKENRLKDLQQRYDSLEKNYINLKQAKVISLSDGEIGQTRERLSKLVREIDRCIESLKK